MADPRFFNVSGPFSLKELADIAGGELSDGADGEARFHDVAPLSEASASDLSFLDNRRYVESYRQSKAGACIVVPGLAEKAPKGMGLVLMDDPYRGYARVARAFYPLAEVEVNISTNSSIDETAELGAGCRIDPGVVIGAGVGIGPRCWIGANSVIGQGVVIGEDCRIGANVTLDYTVIGSQVIVHTGVRIGQDGFGFAMGPQGHLKVPQLGRVIVEDDVEIGANSTIDRGTGPDTVIGAGTKIDNLVQIGHNVRIGKACIIVAQVGISGSTSIGDFAAMGGQVGIAGHLQIGAGAQIAAQSGVMRNIDPGQKIGGSPSQPFREWMRGIAAIEKMSKKKGS
jgi:UDP-3-O-[3-hydroxymyristoyl] glucosamine N-acyltransferase